MSGLITGDAGALGMITALHTEIGAKPVTDQDVEDPLQRDQSALVPSPVGLRR